jgi:hypothetical protein
MSCLSSRFSLQSNNKKEKKKYAEGKRKETRVKRKKTQSNQKKYTIAFIYLFLPSDHQKEFDVFVFFFFF